MFSRALRFSVLFFTLVFSTSSFAANRTIGGGKWMPHQMPGHEQQLKELGLQVDAKELSNLEMGLLRAIVSLGFCSGSFISKSGLIITNHHCVEKMLSYLSQQDRERGIESDFVKTGFHARDLLEERSVGPAQKIYITQKIDEVTDVVLKDIGQIKDPTERQLEVERRMAQIVKETEKDRPAIRAEVKEFYRSSKYYLVEQLELRDIRLVYAPPAMVGFYGGDTDNWHWPRHTGDWAILRAYVAPDGSSQSYDEKNVPYEPKQFLKVAANGLEAGDLVMVAGYPGHTNRLLTADEVARQMKESMPEAIAYFNSIIQTLDELSKTDESLRIKVESSRFSAANVLKKTQEQYDALSRENFLETKKSFQKELHDWIAADKERMLRYGWAPKVLEAIYEKHKQQLDDAVAARLLARSPLLNSAMTIVRMAEERPKPDEEREPAFKERNWPRILQAEVVKQGQLDSRIDVALFNMILSFTDKTVPAEKRPPYVEELLAAWSSNPQLAEELYLGTSLLDQTTRTKLLESATLEELRKSKDPILEMALWLLPVVKAQEKLDRELSGEYLRPMRRYMEALEKFHESKGEMLAPDANSTLRLTYGLAEGYHSPTRDRFFPPFTSARGVLDKHRPGSKEFEAPAELVRALHVAYFDPERKIDSGSGFGPLGDSRYGDLPINFLASVDTTGGNSGSAAMNGKGELIGLLFDGNEDSLATDYRFDRLNRSILLDIRYTLWYLSQVADARNILAEMDIPNKECRDYLLEGQQKPKK